MTSYNNSNPSSGSTSTANSTNNGHATRTATIIEKMTSMTMNKEVLLLCGSHHPHQLPNVNKIPTLREKILFEPSLTKTTSQVFHKSGLPLTSSPAPIRRFGMAPSNAFASAASRFDFDSSLIAKCSRGRAMGCPHFYGQR